jgi:hypothetical protein
MSKLFGDIRGGSHSQLWNTAVGNRLDDLGRNVLA